MRRDNGERNTGRLAGRKVRAVVTSAVALAAGATMTVAVPQSAEAAAFNCRGKSPQHILAKYGYASHRHGYPVPLRCGNKSWGYKHFSHRWSNSFESHLERTLDNPTSIRQGGTTVIVCRKVNATKKRVYFKVVHTVMKNSKSKGIITATWEGPKGTCR